jgi:hypothetical protein
VWIFLEARSLAVVPGAIVLLRKPAVGAAAEEWARLGSGRERWRATWDKRENMGSVLRRSEAAIFRKEKPASYRLRCVKERVNQTRTES